MVLDYGQMGIYIREKSIILAFDPGRDKTGFAFADMEGGLLLSGIFPANERDEFFRSLSAGDVSRWRIEGNGTAFAPSVIAVGDGTYSREFREYVHDRLNAEVLTVDERNTTLEARGLYWRIHRPGLLMRLLPEGLRVPGRVLDDLAAWAVALRALKKYRDINKNKL